MWPNRVFASLVAAVITPIVLAQTPNRFPSPAPQASLGQIVAGGAIVAELAKTVDAKKAKTNDVVEARVTMDVLSRGEILIPRRSKIYGHLITASARTKKSHQSMVEISFDRIVLKNGRDIPLKAAIRAIGAPVQNQAFGNEPVSDLAGQSESPPGPGRNELRGIVSSAYPGSLHPANSAGGSEDPADTGSHGNSASSLGPACQGVFGMKDIALGTTAQGSAISSTSENVHLTSGTQLVLRVLELKIAAELFQRGRN